jgi:hypothetical protein
VTTASYYLSNFAGSARMILGWLLTMPGLYAFAAGLYFLGGKATMQRYLRAIKDCADDGTPV